jgi:hypothetical protein
MDHISKLRKEQDELNKGNELRSASPQNSKSLTTGKQNSGNTDQQTTQLSLSNCKAVVSNSNVAAASDYEVHSPASKRILRSKVDIAAESKIGTANLMTSALKCSGLISESETLSLSSVNCLNVNTNPKNVPGQASGVTKTMSSLLAGQNRSSLLTEFSESESGFLGFRNRDLKDKNSLNGASLERVKLKGKWKSLCCWIASVIVISETELH